MGVVCLRRTSVAPYAPEVGRCTVLIISLFCACATSSSGQVERTLDAYRSALENRDGAALYALLDEQSQSETTPQVLQERLDEHPEAVAAELAGLSGETEVQVRAELSPVGDASEQVIAVQEDGQWRLAGDALGVATLDTPQAALRSFRRALLRRPFEGVFLHLAQESREGFEAEISYFLSETEDVDLLLFQEEEGSASVQTPGDLRITFVRRAGVWRILRIE